MRSILDAGFIFWGLFLVFGVIVVGYILWMRWVEGSDHPVEEPERPGRSP